MPRYGRNYRTFVFQQHSTTNTKVPHMKVPSWNTYQNDVLRCIVGPYGRSAKDTLSTCSWIRVGNRIVNVRSHRERSTDETSASCQVCRNGNVDDILSLNEAQRYVREKLSLQWYLEKNEHGSLCLNRTFVAKNFKFAMSFLNACGEIAEKMGHHPDLHLTSYRTVSVVIYTHKLGGLTMGDFELASRIDSVEAVYSPKWKRDFSWMFSDDFDKDK